MGSAMTTREDVLDALPNHVPGGQLALVQAFTRLFWRHVPADELAGMDLETALGLTLYCWQSIEQRPPLTPGIIIDNPDYERDGWEIPHTAVLILHPDMPFIADSVLMELAQRGLITHRMHNVVLPITRDGQRIVAIGGDDAQRECLILVEIEHLRSEAFAPLRQGLWEVLADVRACVEDFGAMKARLGARVAAITENPPPLPTDEIDESIAFLNWLASDNFTFLGYREFAIEAGTIRQVPGSELGIMRLRPPARDKRIDEQGEAAREFLLEKSLLSFSKSGTRSRVHRPAYPDYVAVKRFSPDGDVIGEYGFWGLYTSPVYTESPLRIPILRRKIETIMQRSGLEPGGFDYKNLLQALISHPRDELFQGSVDELFETAMGIAVLHERHQIRVFIRRDRYGMFFVCLVFVPRELYNTTLREAMERILLEATGASECEFNATFSESILVRVQYILRVDPNHDVNVDAEAIQADIVALTRDWTQDFQRELLQFFGETTARELGALYLKAFPASYRETFPVRLALYDVRHLERLSADRPLVMRFSRPPGDDPRTVHLKLYHDGGTLPLSDVVPTLENLGLRVLGGVPYVLQRADGHELTIHDFHLRSPITLDLHEIGDRFEDAFVRIWYGQADDDRFNRLVIAAELDWREVMLLRAYARYMKQIRTSFGMAFIADTLVKHAEITATLMQLFRARFDPRTEPSEGDITEAVDEISQALDGVQLLNEDRILRRVLELILATVRTNFFQTDTGGVLKDYIALKFDPARISELPAPRPAYEIFVHANNVEGVHLRNGKIARGGLRWSDRAEDFRTEVLGLVKAQVVKNSVIVPTGAKGGFIVRTPPDDRQALADMARVCYQRFVSGLLDITDNSIKGRVVAPHDVRRWDDDDPYLVVAADKGTATFSDIANEISESRGFWLGDAFASGGSHGYDHKKMGITARGAWISVQRHFRERGIDVQTDPVTVIGIGDMSGDVFGNGMLLSRSIHVLAAFDHRHIFIDPYPNPESSFAERGRLFALPRSSWADYDQDLISEGGGVFARSLKSIAITPQMRAVFRIEESDLAPDELINRLLKAPVDLIWNGGIGTYVKASWESHEDADDRANDTVRVNAHELCAQVFGEGGNLGMTQAARVEFDQHGGAVNTDFIDNSAGVDCSDHEVNIKILLNEVVASGDMTVKQRNELLADMTDTVADLVLTNNFRQAQALSLASRHARTRPGEYRRFIATMEAEARLDRHLECIPSDEQLNERQQAGQGLLARPELAVLLSYSKIHLKQALLDSDIHEDPAIFEMLYDHMPVVLRERFPEQIAAHPLAREIVATQVANDVVHHMGPTFVTHLREFVGGEAADVVRAFYIAEACYDLRSHFRRVERLRVPETDRLAMMLSLIQLGRRATRWFLRHRRGELAVNPAIARYHPEVSELVGQHRLILGALGHERWSAESERLAALGVPAEFAAYIAVAPVASTALPIIAATERVDMSCARVAEIFAALGQMLGFDWLYQQLVELLVSSHWEAMERDALMDDLATLQSQLTVAAAQSTGARFDGEESAERTIEHWLAANSRFASAWKSVIDGVRRTGGSTFAMYSMTSRKLGDLARLVSSP